MINGALMVIFKKRSKRFDSGLVSTSDQYFPEESVKTTNSKLKFDLYRRNYDSQILIPAFSVIQNCWKNKK